MGVQTDDPLRTFLVSSHYEPAAAMVPSRSISRKLASNRLANLLGSGAILPGELMENVNHGREESLLQ